MEKIIVDLAERSYPIHIGSNLLSQHALIAELIRGRQVVVVTNETVAPLYLDTLLAGLSDFSVISVILPDGEQFKTVASIEVIFDELLKTKQHRDTTLVALGGGVIGDMTGFAAACYQRGVDFIQVPTTLLAQVDSSVGGKTGVNHPLGKNMIGAFYQPRGVIADISTLQTLSKREFAAGMAEVIKYGLIRDYAFFEWIESNATALMNQDEVILAQAIKRSCEVKAEVVAVDEREGGLRAILNLGHTFGHVIESAMHYQGVLHGEAVAIGTMMAARLSEKHGWISSQDVVRIREIFEVFSLPVTFNIPLTLDEYCDAMMLDKKVKDAKLNLILLEKIGSACITNNYNQTFLREIVTEFL